MAAGCGGSKSSYDVDEVRDAFAANHVAIGRLLDFRNGPVVVHGRTIRAGQGVVAVAEGGPVRLQVMETNSQAEKTAEFWTVLADPGFVTHQGNVAVQVSPPRPVQVQRVKATLAQLDR